MLIVLMILATCISTARMGAVGVKLATHVASSSHGGGDLRGISHMAVLAGGETRALSPLETAVAGGVSGGISLDDAGNC